MDDQIDDSALLKPKPKRIKTPAQQAVWDKACALRIANAKLKRDALSDAKAEIENKKQKVKEPSQPPDPPPALAKAKKTPKIVYEESSESEPEVIVVKKKKKKQQQVVYEEESSEDEAPPPVKKAKPLPVAVAPPPVRIPIVRFF